MIRRIWRYPLTRWQVRILFVIFLFVEYLVGGIWLPIFSFVAMLVVGGIPFWWQQRSRKRPPSN